MVEEMASADLTAKRIERVRFGTARADYLLLLDVAALLLVGLMMAYSTTFDWSYNETSNPMTFFIKQMMWVVMGVVAMVLLSRIDYFWWRKLAVPVMGAALALLVLVLVFGSVRFGAQRTFLNGSVQPSEPAKLAIIIYVAAWLSSKGAKLRKVTYGLIPFAVLIGLVAGLIVLQPDFSTAILIVLTAGAMFFIAGADIFQVLLGCAVSGGTFYLLISNSTHGSERLKYYLDTVSNPELVPYHVNQALVALGSGGLLGRGLGAGYQKFGYLPAPHTDSVFAVLGEELGLIGCLLVVALFGLLAQRGFKIALEARDPFGAVLASGLTCWLIFQALINVAVMTGLIPFTGIPLPFLSVGGSAMVSSLAAVGLLLSVSRGSQAAAESRPPHEPVTASSQIRESEFAFTIQWGGRGRARATERRRDRRSRVPRPGRR
jgi:cell division protein FtsW